MNTPLKFKFIHEKSHFFDIPVKNQVWSGWCFIHEPDNATSSAQF